jgi:sugar phosphate permease
MLISSQWYTKSEQAPRFSFWYCGLGAGQIFGGIISFGFQHVKGDFAGWKVMFIVVGLITSLIGVAAFLILPDTPMKATFLSDAEKTALLEHVAVNQTGIENHQFKWSHLKEIILDIQIWLMVLITILVREDTFQLPAVSTRPNRNTDLSFQWCHHNLFLDFN